MPISGPTSSQTDAKPVQNLAVYPAKAFRVAHGVNQGDALSDASDLVLEDIYELTPTAAQDRLALATGDAPGSFAVAAGSGLGRAGAPVYLDCLITLMGPHSRTEEALILVELDPGSGTIARTYLHPLTALEAKAGYALVTIDRDAARARLAESACVSFTRGTRITMADGHQVPIEALREGDKVLTRDSGPQQVRWIGEQTMRAAGAFAPIEIAAGALNNDAALTVSPNHRLFIYQRTDRVGAGVREVLVKARLLVNGTSVIQSRGGFVDYFQILFDKHEIIYAEGIAAESLFVDTANRPVLPPELRKRLKSGSQAAGSRARELGEADLAAGDAVDLLRRASSP